MKWFIETYENTQGNTVLSGNNCTNSEGDCATVYYTITCYIWICNNFKCNDLLHLLWCTDWNQNFYDRCILNMQWSTDPTVCNNHLLDMKLDTKTKCKMNGKSSNQGPKKNVHRPLQSLEKYCLRPLKILQWNLALWKRNTKNLCTVLYMQVKNPGNVS